MCKIRPTVNTAQLFNVRTYVICLKFLWMAVCMTFIGRLRDSPIKRKLYVYAYTTCFQILGGSLSAVITYHQEQNKPKNGICVANHTSPIDVLILACDNAYDLVRKNYLSIYLLARLSFGTNETGLLRFQPLELWCPYSYDLRGRVLHQGFFYVPSPLGLEVKGKMRESPTKGNRSLRLG